MCRDCIVNLIVRPPRRDYDPDKISNLYRMSDNSIVERVALKIQNSKGMTILGSLYPAPDHAPEDPCVIYLHGNASSQNEGSWLAFELCPLGISVCCIDTQGCGESDGEIIGLGYFERDDVKSTMDYLRKNFKVDRIALWGRSMGASIAAWCASDGMDLAGIIADSAYGSLNYIVQDLCGNSWALWLLAKLLVPWVNSGVKKKAGYSISDIDIISIVSKAKCPAMFVHAVHDSFINIREAREMYTRYGSRKKYLITAGGDHNSPRNMNVRSLEVMFLLDIFGIDVGQPMAQEEEFEDNSSAHFQNAFDMYKHM